VRAQRDCATAYVPISYWACSAPPLWSQLSSPLYYLAEMATQAREVRWTWRPYVYANNRNVGNQLRDYAVSYFRVSKTFNTSDGSFVAVRTQHLQKSQFFLPQWETLDIELLKQPEENGILGVKRANGRKRSCICSYGWRCWCRTGDGLKKPR
jgi:hypothetical protein